ncbi:hypothetical protein O181_085774 [Austropuccinia psidii MF-1]|uniref:Chromo domain-containing protein n=1 Tax=Austropuccinia psidii MF-1 TaxID=1389203 RepID=A0A9Q3FVQ1_9BASI|nr:hypothetical protein [Austropuccinia psidii MF-1]
MSSSENDSGPNTEGSFSDTQPFLNQRRRTASPTKVPAPSDSNQDSSCSSKQSEWELDWIEDDAIRDGNQRYYYIRYTGYAEVEWKPEACLDNALGLVRCYWENKSKGPEACRQAQIEFLANQSDSSENSTDLENSSQPIPAVHPPPKPKKLKRKKQKKNKSSSNSARYHSQSDCASSSSESTMNSEEQEVYECETGLAELGIEMPYIPQSPTSKAKFKILFENVRTWAQRTDSSIPKNINKPREPTPKIRVKLDPQLTPKSPPKSCTNHFSNDSSQRSPRHSSKHLSKSALIPPKGLDTNSDLDTDDEGNDRDDRRKKTYQKDKKKVSRGPKKNLKRKRLRISDSSNDSECTDSKDSSNSKGGAVNHLLQRKMTSQTDSIKKQCLRVPRRLRWADHEPGGSLLKPNLKKQSTDAIPKLTPPPLPIETSTTPRNDNPKSTTPPSDDIPVPQYL